MIITSEIQKADQSVDQSKASSYQSPQYIQAPGIFISSTTEPAIPILRLSNEMDLDGSFSYEALGADQTHYVQHSRMENMGSDKEEQVVEGSYSYVGDNGRTYTVHYVADSNGFRATGDHLPVPPPIPEIIQRAVQYNLAEEAKKPPHLKSSWENDDKEYELNERGFYNNQPSRNLFTGKTPEAFSFGYSQGSNTQNNLVTAESFQVPAKQNYEMQQSKSKVNPMPTPQITFLASQGAHNPSTQSQLSAKATSEKSALPQLMNYEAEIKDHDQEANKALWRWQYGLNANIDQNPKNSISRSFAEGDDVVINFGEMTPDQYTNMIHTQILSQNAVASNNADYNAGNRYQPSNENQNINKTFDEPNGSHLTTEPINLYTQNIDEMTKNPNNMYNDSQEQIYKQEDKSINKKETSGIRSDIISRHNFIPQSQIATQSYTFDETSFEPSKITIPNGNAAVNLKTIHKFSDPSSNYNERPSTTEPISNTLKTTLNFYINEENSSFRPITYNSEKAVKQETTTTEASISEVLRDNIFLRNLFKPSNTEEKVTNKSTIENNAYNENQEIKLDTESKYYNFQENPQNEIKIVNKQTNNANKENQEIKHDKESKYFHMEENYETQKPKNEIKTVKSKPLDINNILNYMVLKNHFESVKTKPKSKPVQHYIQNSNLKDIPTHYVPIKENTNYYVEPNDDDIQKQDNDFRTLNRHQQQELQGLIKNYKVLQRHKNTMPKSQSLPEPQRHIKAFHTQNLPPLGRAGPSMKSYLPPTYL
nr:uncharacterized protein LOC117990249 [Maniola hyperantus]